MNDLLQKFIFDKYSVRGAGVVLDLVWHHILDRHSHPPVVMTLLGELSAACVLLSSSFKFDGSLIMQIHGEGPVRLLLVECNTNMQIRATVKVKPGATFEGKVGLNHLINQNGNGRFVITLVPLDEDASMKPYQGVVNLGGESIASVIEEYMRTSAQVETRLWLAADALSCRGFLLQKLPIENLDLLAEDYWSHVLTLAATLSENDLLTLDIQTLLHRLYWEEDVRVFEADLPEFFCSCSREKVADMLSILGRQEVDSVLAEFGEVKITCDFCGQKYILDAVDCAHIFQSLLTGQPVHVGKPDLH